MAVVSRAVSAQAVLTGHRCPSFVGQVTIKGFVKYLLQVSVQVISKGPNDMDLIGTYQNSEKWDYQDEVGEILSRVCQVELFFLNVVLIMLVKHDIPAYLTINLYCYSFLYIHI